MTCDQLQIPLDQPLDEVPERHDEFLLRRSRISVMHSKADALVFSEGPRELFEQPEKIDPSSVRQSSSRQPSAGAIGRLADLSAVNAACRQPQRCEQSIELLDRPAADQGKRTIEAPFGGGQSIHETGWNFDRLRPRRQIEEGPIDIEKKTDLLRPQIHRVQRVHSTVAFFYSRAHTERRAITAREWMTSWFTGTVACSGVDNPESGPASPFHS